MQIQFKHCFLQISLTMNFFTWSVHAAEFSTSPSHLCRTFRGETACADLSKPIQCRAKTRQTTNDNRPRQVSFFQEDRQWVMSLEGQRLQNQDCEETEKKITCRYGIGGSLFATLNKRFVLNDTEQDDRVKMWGTEGGVIAVPFGRTLRCSASKARIGLVR